MYLSLNYHRLIFIFLNIHFKQKLTCINHAHPLECNLLNDYVRGIKISSSFYLLSKVFMACDESKFNA